MNGHKGLLFLELLVVYGIIMIRDGISARPLVGATLIGAFALGAAEVYPAAGITIETAALIDVLFFGKGANIVSDVGGWLVGGSSSSSSSSSGSSSGSLGNVGAIAGAGGILGSASGDTSGSGSQPGGCFLNGAPQPAGSYTQASCEQAGGTWLP